MKADETPNLFLPQIAYDDFLKPILMELAGHTFRLNAATIHAFTSLENLAKKAIPEGFLSAKWDQITTSVLCLSI
jgi:hypothetical protein